MIKLPLVSVVIPAFNAEKTILACLDSVRLQTYSELEIIVVNDGSTDRTPELLGVYQKEHSLLQLKVFHQKNAGPSAARNYGIAEAKGEYIAFLDADDRWVSDKIENQLCVFKSDNKMGLVGGLISVGVSECTDESFEIKEISLKKLLFKNYFMTSSVICRREILSEINFNASQKYAEDYRLWLDIVSRGIKCVVLQRRVTIMNDKPLFGSSGLSAKLWEMEKGEMSNFLFLKRKNKIGTLYCLSACIFSLFKFLRRFFVSSFRDK